MSADEQKLLAADYRETLGWHYNFESWRIHETSLHFTAWNLGYIHARLVRFVQERENLV